GVDRAGQDPLRVPQLRLVDVADLVVHVRPGLVVREKERETATHARVPPRGRPTSRSRRPGHPGAARNPHRGDPAAAFAGVGPLAIETGYGKGAAGGVLRLGPR